MNFQKNIFSLTYFSMFFIFLFPSILFAQKNVSTDVRKNTTQTIKINNENFAKKKQTVSQKTTKTVTETVPKTTPETVIKGNRFLRTKYFDIIYPPQSKKSALLLYEHADAYAEEISALLNTQMKKKRIPVYLIANNQLLNAYFAIIPYNHIVLYDTGIFESELSNLKDNILMVFYHELTHAISLNIRSPFWQGMSAVFGDALSPNMLWSMPLSFIEGITVSFESNRDQQGRLNDPFIHHYFTQNKIEKKSPLWQDAASPQQIYPYAKWSYLYGGAFSRYLQEKYGMENYAKLWHRGGRIGLFKDSTIRKKFEKTYNVTLDYAWQDFLSSLPVPKKITTNSNRIDKTKKKEQKLYGAITSCGDNFIWTDFEKRAVFVQKKDSLKSKPKKLFDTDSLLHRLSCSQDGTLLLVSAMSSIASYPQNIVRIFDMQKKQFLQESYKSLRDADFVYDNTPQKNPRYIVGVRQKNQDIELVLIDRFSLDNKSEKDNKSKQDNKSKNKFGKNKKEKLHDEKILMNAGAGESFAAFYNPSYADNGNIAFLAANGMQRKILFLNVFAKNSKVTALSLQDVEAMRYLQSTSTPQGWVLTFSFVPSLAADNLGKHLYRLAKYNMQTKQLYLQQEDISGGVFSSTVYKNNIYYIAHFADTDALLKFPQDTGGKNISSIPIAFVLPQATSLGVQDFSVQGKRYRSARWLVDGLFLPFVAIPKNITKYNYLAPAFLYATADPTERFQLQLNPIKFYVKPFFADITANLAYVLQPNFMLDTILRDSIPNGFDSDSAYRKSGMDIGFRFATSLDVNWRQFIFTASSGFHRYAPNLHNYKNPYNAPYIDNFTYIDTTLSFVMFKKSRFKRRLFFGEIKRGLQLNLESYTPINTKTKQASPLLQTMGDFYFPILPLRSSFSFAWSNNMSLNSQGYFFKGEKTYSAGITKYIPTLAEYAKAPYAYNSSPMLFGFDIELFLLTWNVEKAVPSIKLFFHDFLISTGYRSNLLFASNSSSKLYLDSIYLRTSVNMSLLSGLHSFPLAITLEYAYPLRQYDGFKSKGKFQVLANVSF